MRINNLSDSLAVRQARKIKKLSKRAPLERSAVNQGRVRLIGGELLGEAGSQQTWHGNALFDGEVGITLSLTVGGNTVIGGSVAITEQLDVSAETVLRALTTLLGDFVVSNGGRITVDGDIPLDIENGRLTFANGAFISGDADGMVLSGGSGAELQLSLGSATLAAGGNSVGVSGTGILVVGVTDFNDDVILNGDLYGNDFPAAPIAGVASGTLVREPTSKRIYVAI